MNAETLHDAIGLLPSDLVAQADRQRSRKHSPVSWQRYAALAACAAMLLCTGYFFSQLSRFGEKTSAAPEMLMQDTAAASAEVPAVEAAPPANALPESAAGSHVHSPAQTPAEAPVPMQGEAASVTVRLGEEAHTLQGPDAAALMEILRSLDYSEETLCRCAPEFTADIETGAVYEVSLTRYFVRCQGKQAALTEEEASQIEAILNAREE